MTALVTDRFRGLAQKITDLKGKVRTALATELASAVGTAVRDVLVVALLERVILPSQRVPLRVSASPSSVGWRDEYERDTWGERRDPWDERDDYEDRPARPTVCSVRDSDEPEVNRTLPSVTAVAVGVNVGRWWLSRRGSVGGAVGAGIVTTLLGLAGGPLARTALAVFAAASDVLTAESALARSDLS
jgi:hypothetical protein